MDLIDLKNKTDELIRYHNELFVKRNRLPKKTKELIAQMKITIDAYEHYLVAFHKLPPATEVK